MANPKSTIFQPEDPLTILAGFRSRCTMPLESRYLMPLIIYCMMLRACSYWKGPYLAMNFMRSPFWQYSVTI